MNGLVEWVGSGENRTEVLALAFVFASIDYAMQLAQQLTSVLQDATLCIAKMVDARASLSLSVCLSSLSLLLTLVPT